MKYSKIGQSPLSASSIALGLMRIGSKSPAQVQELLEKLISQICTNS